MALRHDQFVSVATVCIAPSHAAVLSQHGSMAGLTGYCREFGLLQVTVNLPEAVSAGRAAETTVWMMRAVLETTSARSTELLWSCGLSVSNTMRAIPVQSAPIWYVPLSFLWNPSGGGCTPLTTMKSCWTQVAEAIEGNDADAIDPREAGGAVRRQRVAVHGECPVALNGGVGTIRLRRACRHDHGRESDQAKLCHLMSPIFANQQASCRKRASRSQQGGWNAL